MKERALVPHFLYITPKGPHLPFIRDIGRIGGRGVVRQSSVLVYRHRDALAHDLHQRCLRLGQPKGHIHGAV
jgi:hypothetical protein